MCTVEEANSTRIKPPRKKVDMEETEELNQKRRKLIP
jgi:hypothetical protein